ncbi:hypothetical protein FRUB_06332 [Fimbriiglobus ruber]|uniref:Uncharacterized protein n=1 Tax=Fimbriiglobus ruber TaxID=1908690 RepID=A0A225DNB7_9BACT|nr:hypothetical protein FRUB_06332 [Fimbriiglobus ruber]
MAGQDEVAEHQYRANEPSPDGRLYPPGGTGHEGRLCNWIT